MPNAHPFAAAMREAAGLARKAAFQAAPNPCVGAVLVKNGQIVAGGFHRGTGQAHAEVEALNDAASKGISPADCTLVVTLEPCRHHGKTPPCTDAVLRAGIRHVVVGTRDPNPEASGGVEILRAQGVQVDEGVLEQECRDLIEDFRIWTDTALPYTVLKLASTMDGRIATRSGHSKWITCEETRRRVHELRAQTQAVIVGGNTFYADDPMLTVRDANGDETGPQPLAVVVTSRLPDAGASFNLLKRRPGSTLFWTTAAAAASPTAAALRKLGVRIFGLSSRPAHGGGMRAEMDLAEGLALLRAEFGCRYVLCEGGGRLGLSLLEKGLARELHLHMAPKILGDADAVPLFSGRTPAQMEDALRLRVTHSERCGTDVLVTMRSDIPPAVPPKTAE